LVFLHRRRIASIATSGRIGAITGSGRIATSRRISSGSIATSGRIASGRRIATSRRITTSRRIAAHRRIATHRRSHHRGTAIARRWRSHAHAVGGDDQVDGAASLATREVDKRLGEVVPLVNAAHGEALADGDHGDTKSIVGGETIPVHDLHLEHVGHGGGTIEGELLVPDGRKSVADDLGLADVAPAKVADGGKKIGSLVHDAELGEGIALASGIGGSEAAGFNDTDSDTAHCQQ